MISILSIRTRAGALSLASTLALFLSSGLPAARAAQPPSGGAADADSLVAKIDGQAVHLGELQDVLNHFQASSGNKLQDLKPEERQKLYLQILDRLIDDRLIMKAASSVKVPAEAVDARYNRFVEQVGGAEQMKKELAEEGKTPSDVRGMIEQSIRQRTWMESQFQGKTEVTDEDVKKLYDSSPDVSQVPPMVRASHILILVPQGSSKEVEAAKRAEAEKIRARLVAGEDFGLVAKTSSEDPGSKDLAGDLNFFSKQRMVPEFAEAAFAMKVGELSQPVRTKFGFHLIKVTDKKDARRLSLEESKEKLKMDLTNSKREEIVRQVIAGLRSGAKIEIFLK
jgi:peptidyl-prolyl cis-trans isomerase C